MTAKPRATCPFCNRTVLSQRPWYPSRNGVELLSHLNQNGKHCHGSGIFLDAVNERSLIKH